MKTPYEKFLKETIKLAEKGKGLVSPNPMVGAIVVKGKRVLGKGFHQIYGGPHAEVEALRQAGERAKGATLFVNLEPCCHYGKTPPCTDMIISYGIKEVVSCMEDPNPLVNGKGFKILEENGIKVRVGWLREEAEELNRSYITYITKRRPYVVLKWAQSIDGKIATYSGDSKWITSEKSRQIWRMKRFEYDGIVVGINTVLKDNPYLDFIPPHYQTKKRLIEKKRYYKIVLDTHLRIPTDANIFKNEKSKVLIFTSSKTPDSSVERLKLKNCEIIKVGEDNGKIKIKEVLEKLFQLEIGIIIVEGGKEVITSFWEEKIVDEVIVFIGNKIIGGENSLSPIGGKDIEDIDKVIKIDEICMERIDSDILIIGKPCFQE